MYTRHRDSTAANSLLPKYSPPTTPLNSSAEIEDGESRSGDSLTLALNGDYGPQSIPWKSPRRRSRGNFLRWTLILFGLVIVLCLVIVAVHEFLWSRSLQYQDPVIGSRGAVAAEHIECSTIGVDMLKQGGSAVDAAIASAICIGTINCFSSGIGGGGFMLVRDKSGSAELLDFRETAPALANTTMYKKKPIASQVGGLSVAVPGEIRGFEMAHRRYGRLSWAALFRPSIALARRGFTVTKTMASRFKEDEQYLLNNEAFREVFAPDGRLLREGDTLKRERFAATLEQVADRGADAFYTGPIAQSLVRSIRETGGIMTMKDFAAYEAVSRPPVIGYYHGQRIITGPAPTSGPILLSILNLMERYNLAATGSSPLNIHRLVEAFKFGYAQRTELGDPAFLNISARLEEIISKSYADLVRHNLTDWSTHNIDYYHPQYEPVENAGTTHVSAVDEDDMAVALTSTINLSFGSKVMDRETGIILNNEMDDFSSPGLTNAFGLRPSKNNFIQPGKRPLSSAVPTIVEQDGRFSMAIGASGGSKIITATAQALINVLDHGMNVQRAISYPRIHHQLLPNQVRLESEYCHAANADIKKTLEKSGHQLECLNEHTTLADVQAVMKIRRHVNPEDPQEQVVEVHAGADPRKGGQAAAY